MKIEQKHWTSEKGWEVVRSGEVSPEEVQLVLVFGARTLVEKKEMYEEIHTMYKNADIIVCSSAGEIIDTRVRDNSLSVTAIQFEKSSVQCVETTIASNAESEAKGSELAKMLQKDELHHVMVFSDGLLVNGTALVTGIRKELPETVSVTGGLVGDGADFKTTAVGLNTSGGAGRIVLIGFYGNALKIGYGSLGGWDPFGPNRLITKSENNVLFELDDKPALALYKEYLGEEAAGLPGSGLLFPLQLTYTENGKDTEVVRTLLAVDENANSMTFAGDMPEGAHATLMKANFDRLVEGARGAAEMTKELADRDAELAILISCIGRKLVLKERIEDETEAVRSIIGNEAAMAGFYSYGEISPVAATEKQCRLHNQTMTITTFTEI